MQSFRASILALGCLSVAACSGGGNLIADAGSPYVGHLYAATNAAAGNALVHYGRKSDGTLIYLSTETAAGNGIGSANVASGSSSVDPLFSSDSVIIDATHTHVFAVNAGSNSVTSFSLDADGAPHRIGAYPTGGNTPTSLALHDSILYVGHAKAGTGGAQIIGMRVASDGSLTAISGAAYAPSAATVVAQVLFNATGSQLEVSELLAGKIAMYPVQTDGTLGTPTITTSNSAGPFGARFDTNGHLIVAEAHPGEMNAGSVSSYSASAGGALTVVSPSVVNAQNATCWVRISPNGRFVYASNTTTGNVSVYGRDDSGALTLIDANQAARPSSGAVDFMGNPSSGPVDAVVSSDGKYYYQQYSGLGIVGGYAIGADGRLNAISGGDGGNLPTVGAEGLAGY